MTPSLKPDASQRLPQRTGRAAPRLATLAGATAMAMVLAACVQTGAHAPIQYAQWPSPAPATPVLPVEGGFVQSGPALSSTYLGQPTNVTYLGGVQGIGAGVAPFYDSRLAAAPVYSPTTNYLSDVAYGGVQYGAPIVSQTIAPQGYASAPIYDPPGYSLGSVGQSVSGSYVQPAIPTTTSYAAPSLSYAPAPIHDPAAPSYNYAYGAGYGAVSGGVTLYDGRLPAAPVYGAGTNYVASRSMAPIHDPQDYRPAAQTWGQSQYAAAPAPVYAAPTTYAAPAPTYAAPTTYAAPAPTYAAPTTQLASAPIHNPWPPQSQSYGQSYGTVQTINATPWTNAYAPAPQPSYQSYAPSYAPQPQSVAGLGLALNQYASTYAQGDVLFRLSDADLRAGVRPAPAQPQTLSYGGVPYHDVNVPAPGWSGLSQGQNAFGLGGYQGSQELGLSAAPSFTPNYQPPTGYVQPYAPPPNLSGPYPRPYAVGGLGIYPASPVPTGVASARVGGSGVPIYDPAPSHAAPTGYAPSYAAPVFAPGTPIYADPRNQRYVREIVRLPQQTPGLATNAASLRSGAILPASGGPAYQVAAGDTLYRIARSHGISVEALASANGLGLNAVIHPGQPLFIPRGSIGPAVPVFETVAQIQRAAPAPASIQTGSVSSPEFVWPLRGPLSAKRDAYGVTSVEVKGAAGAPVRAAAAGEAIHVENGPQGFMVVLDHGGGWTSIHVGLAEVGLRVGQRVEAGARLGVLAPRAEPGLVFELRRNNLPVDPTDRMRG